jgi:DNA polymerase V
MANMFALIDCNNFYCSCERVFQPKLKDIPVAVLSNNDGCVIARSNEVKALGVPMGAPYFKWKGLFQKNGVRVFSPNFELYGDMSDRVMQTIRPFTERMEIYSIDEAFTLLPDLPQSALSEYSQEMRSTVIKNTGIPVSVGVAPTKTLAKVALELIKKTPTKTGSLDINQMQNIDTHLEKLTVRDVWGIGSALTKRLQEMGILTIRQLKYANERMIKKTLHTPGLRTVMELNGVSCLPLEENDQPSKSVLCSRSFSRPILEYTELREAVSAFASLAGEKLRKEKRNANVLTVFVETGRFKKEHWYRNGKSIPLTRATNFTPDIIAAAEAGLKKIFLPDRSYKRAGILLSELERDSGLQPDLFQEMNTQALERRSRAMSTLDAINKKFGTGAAKFLAEGIQQSWKMKRKLKSPAWTTRLTEIPVAKC